MKKARGAIVYQLNRQPDEHAGEGEYWSEWFTSLREARKRRANIVHEAESAWNDEKAEWLTKYGADSTPPPRPRLDLSIDRVYLADLPPKQLALAILNRRGFVAKAERVVESLKG